MRQVFYQICIKFGIIFLLLVSSCAPQRIEKFRSCPGKDSPEQSLAALKGSSNQIKPLKASGRCLAKFLDNGKQRKENFPIKFWFDPPGSIRLHGEIAFNPRALDIGCNENEFWIALKPKELGSSFFWGLWADQSDVNEMKIGPASLLEAFGNLRTDDLKSWSLEKTGPFDVLVQKDGERLIKKIHIYNCDYRIRKIEYFDSDNKIVFFVKLSYYKQVSEEFLFPDQIEITGFDGDKIDQSFRLDFVSIKPASFTEENRKVFFNRPVDTRGFKSIFRLINGQAFEQEKD